jgi:predicted ribonuclease YlaK
MEVVADTSALVSLGIVADADWNPLDHLLANHTLVLPARVIDELDDTAAYDDASGTAAERVLDRQSALDVRHASLDDSFPLDDGENAAIVVANECDATQFLCDEFNQLALVHASLIDTRLVTTPLLLVAFVQNGAVSASTAQRLIERMADARSWSNNTYVERATAVLEGL